MNRIDRTLTIAAGVVIVSLTVAAFWLSYAHLHAVAADHGLGASMARSWAWPATLDLVIVAGELLMLRASLARRVDPWAIGLTVVGSGGSIALNVFGVNGGSVLDYVVAAVPPTAALLAFGALMRQVHTVLTRDPATPAAPVATPAPAVATPAVAAPQRTPAAPVATPATARVAAAAAPQRPRVATAPVTPATPLVAPRRSTPAAPATQQLAAEIEDALQPVATDLDGVQLMTVADVAAAKGVAPGTVRSWVSRNKLTPVARDDDGRSLFHPNAVADLD